MVDVDFSPYLEFVRTSPRYHETLSWYTATDAIHLVLEAQTVVREDGEGREGREPKQQVERFPVLEGLRKYASNHVLLSGKPGSGKSTTLKRLLLEMVEVAQITVGAKHLGDKLSEKPKCLYPNASPSQGLATHPIPSSPEKGVWGEVKIPVLVQLKSDSPILESIQAEFEKGDLDWEVKDIKRLLRQKQLFLLLDGVNEIPSEELRRKLQEFRENNPHTPMIFTTRDLAVGGDLGIEKKLEMRPLTDRQMREFVGKYLPEYGDLLLGQLEDRLREVGETPLLLKMLCEVFDPETRQIPKSKGELFRAFDGKYHQHKQNPPVSGDFRRFQSEVLQYLAFEMMRGDGEKPTEAWLRISRQKAEGILESWLGKRQVADGATKAKEWLEDLLEHHLLQIAADGREIEFHHQLFQEYYAAEALLVMLENRHPDVMDDGRLQHFFLNYLKWTEPVALMVALLKDEAHAVRVVRLALAVDLQLGARLAGEVQPGFQVQTVGMVSELEIPEWFRIFLLGTTKSPKAVDELIKKIKHSDSSIRRQSVWVSRQLGSTAAMPVIFTAIKDSEPHVRETAIRVIGDLIEELKREQLISVLAEIITKDPIASVRESAARVLGKLDYESAILGLLRATEDIDHNVSVMAIHYLEEMNRQLVVAVLTKALKNIDVSICKSAAKMLGDIGDEKIVNDLFAAQLDLNTDVHHEASVALYKVRNRATPKESYVTECQELQRKHQIDYWIKYLNSNEPVARGNAISSLTILFSKETAITLATQALDDPHHYVRKHAITSLVRLMGKEAIPIAVNALNDPHHDVRDQSAQELAGLGQNLPDSLEIPDETVSKMIQVLNQEQNTYVRSVILRTLTYLCSIQNSILLREDLEIAFLNASYSSDNFLRSTAAKGLGKFNSEISSIKLLQMIEDSASFVALSATEALKNMPTIITAKHLPALIELNVNSTAGLEGFTIDAISTIQSHCQFYNYEIFTARLPPVVSPQQLTDNPVLNALQKINQGVQKMSEKPNQDFSQATFNAPVNFAPNQGSQDVQNIETNYGKVIGKQVQASTEDIEKLISDFQQFILNLQQKYTQITDETAIAQIIDVEAKLIESQDKPRFANFLNLKRLWNGGKKAALKVGEHFVEENPWGKGAIAFLEGVTEEVEEKK